MVAVAALVAASWPAWAANCSPGATEGEDVRLASTSAELGLSLSDGRRVRLEGLDVETLRLPALSGREATLLAAGDIDRHGAVKADLWIDGESLAEQLVGEGAARVRPVPGDRPCHQRLLMQEEVARQAGLGLWAEPGYSVLDASDPRAVARHAGRFVILSGRVRHVGARRDRIFIDFGEVWRDDVTVVIATRHRARFEAAGVDPAGLEGRRVRVRGVVSIDGGPRIDVTEPAAVEQLLDGT
jgi:hypothetical protein